MRNRDRLKCFKEVILKGEECFKEGKVYALYDTGEVNAQGEDVYSLTDEFGKAHKIGDTKESIRMMFEHFKFI